MEKQGYSLTLADLLTTGKSNVAAVGCSVKATETDFNEVHEFSVEFTKELGLHVDPVAIGNLVRHTIARQNCWLWKIFNEDVPLTVSMVNVR